MSLDFSAFADEKAAEAAASAITDITLSAAKQMEATLFETRRRQARREADEKDAKQAAIELRNQLNTECVDIADVDTLRADDYVVKHLVYLPGIAVVHSPPGVGKSFLALDLSCSVALGLPSWCGRRIKRAMKVLYVYSEGVTRLWKRRDAWLSEHDVDLSDLAGRITFYPKAVPLNTSDAYVDTLVEFIKEGGFEVVVFDTWATATTGSDENSAGDMGVALARCGRLRDEANVGVIVVHHDSKAGGYRGSTAIDGYADTRLSIARDGPAADRNLTVKIEKQRDDVTGTQWGGRLKVWDVGTDADGESITSVVFVYVPDDTVEAPPAKVSDFKAVCARVWKYIQDAHNGLLTESLGYDAFSYPLPLVKGIFRNTDLGGTPKVRTACVDFLVARGLVSIRKNVQRLSDEGIATGKRYDTPVPLMNADLTFNDLTFDDTDAMVSL